MNADWQKPRTENLEPRTKTQTETEDLEPKTKDQSPKTFPLDANLLH